MHTLETGIELENENKAFKVNMNTTFQMNTNDLACSHVQSRENIPDQTRPSMVPETDLDQKRPTMCNHSNKSRVS